MQVDVLNIKGEKTGEQLNCLKRYLELNQTIM